MAAESNDRRHGERRRNTRPTVDPVVTDGSASGPSKLELMQKVFLAPFQHKKRDSTRILSDLAPVIMTPRMMNSASTVASRPRASVGDAGLPKSRMDFATLGRAPLRIGFGNRRLTSRDLQIVEATEELLDAEVPEPEGVASNVSLLRGFNATIPSADQSRTRRRQMRNVETPRIGLKKLGMSARGLLTEEEDHEGQSVASEDDVVVVPRADAGKKGKKRGRESLSTLKTLGKEELTRQTKEIQRDKENLHVRRSLINSEIAEITNKIEALDSIRAKLGQDLLKLQEDELELDDELAGVKERLEFEQAAGRTQKASAQPLHLPSSSRRRKGPAFLPSEHDELPPGVAFMTLESHTTPITALDFSEPYGTLVTASLEDAQPRVWDLFSGIEIGRLQGHSGTVKCIQVEDHVCLTGGEDGDVRLWDLRRVEDDNDGWGDVSLSDVAEEVEDDADRRSSGTRSSIRDGAESTSDGVIEKNGPCVRRLEGHSKAVTALFFEDECLVTGASDKTLRQWDLTTGQCVLTMDILWAISHPPRSHPGGASGSMYDVSSSTAGPFAVPTPPYADGTWDMYEDFVGGVQFWGYGLVSGSGDGAVRMWDMRTGQAHRTLLGHTAPVTCLQFDEIHIASGSLDKTIRIWDLRTGGVFETIKYDHGVTGLQFDTRKIIAATGENGVKIYNRTSMQHSTLYTNGHTKPVERLRYMDRYLVTGGRDAALKIWSL
ncbi:putative WD40 repeat-like protein [Lyophyllum shimeji]|uniref:WD40 repeat-like protein n=1 Tax=Lyophyllum shimeji TaxID=47721 RepID=A0A9P3PJN2_LYOSH|nr:putative WD40 repeat-like protein [Lyophyllum shimeji]